MSKKETDEVIIETKQKKRIEISIQDLPGVGAATAEKLNEAGFNDLMSIAVASPAELIDIAGMTEATARKVINAARSKMDMGFESGDELLEKRANILRISTGSKALDALFGGGVESNGITECYGPYGAGKSALAHQLSVNVQLHKDKDGAEGMAVWIDSESTFRPERIKQIAEAMGIDPIVALKNIKVGRAFNSDHQVLMVDKIKDMIEKDKLPVKLVIVDSLMSHFRSDFSGRGQLADRQQKLNKHMHALLKLAMSYNLVVYVTNQVMARPDVFFGDPTEAIGGHVLAHACLTADSLIQLSDGNILPIGDINKNTEVIGASLEDFKIKKSVVDEIFVNLDTKRIYELETTGNKIKASADHKFFRLENFETKEVALRDLRVGDYLARVNKLSFELTEQRLPKIENRELFIVTDEGSRFIKNELVKLGYTRKGNSRKNICKNLKINSRQLRRVLNQSYPTNRKNILLLINSGVDNRLLELVQPFYTTRHRQIIMPEFFTPEIAQILGYFIGDGNFEEYSLRFRDERLEVIQHYSNIFKEIFNVNGNISKVSNKNCFKLNINNKEIRQLFLELKENMFSYVSKSPLEHTGAFVRGFMDAEGSVSKNRSVITIGQKDEFTLKFIQLLLYRFGIHANLEKLSRKDREFYYLRIEGKDLLRFGQDIGLTSTDKRLLLEKWIKKHQNMIDRKPLPINRKLIWGLVKENGLYPSHFMDSKPECKFMSIDNVKKLLHKLDHLDIKKPKLKDKIQFVKDLVNGDMVFDKIKKIKEIENNEVLYDLSSLYSRNYIANGFIVHNSTYRVYLRRGKKGTRVAKMVDAPHLPDSEAVFAIAERGIVDVKE